MPYADKDSDQLAYPRSLNSITKTRLYNFDLLKPHFYIVEPGLMGIHYFSYFDKKT